MFLFFQYDNICPTPAAGRGGREAKRHKTSAIAETLFFSYTVVIFLMKCYCMYQCMLVLSTEG